MCYLRGTLISLEVSSCNDNPVLNLLDRLFPGLNLEEKKREKETKTQGHAKGGARSQLMARDSVCRAVASSDRAPPAERWASPQFSCSPTEVGLQIFW